jgi:DNA modification methylase
MPKNLSPNDGGAVIPLIMPQESNALVGAANAAPRVRQRTRPQKPNSSDGPLSCSVNRVEPNLAIEHLPIDLPKPSPRELRKHSEAQHAAVRGSIRTFGLNAPVVVDADNVVIDGHAVLEAAKALGYTTIPVLRLEHLSSIELRAYRIAVHKLSEQTSWDEEAFGLEILELLPLLIGNDIALEAMGMSTTAIDLIMTSATEPAIEEEDGIKADVAAVCQPGDLWALGEHLLLCGDCLKEETLARLMGDDKARMVLTDPPYNLEIEGFVSGNGKHGEFAMGSGEMSDAEFLTFLTHYIVNLIAYCVDGAIQFHAMDGKHIHLLIQAVLASGAEYKQLCVWNKSNAGMGAFYRSKHELFVVAKVGSAPHTNNFGLGESGRYRSNVWDYAGASGFRKGRSDDLDAHPTVKPTALVADAIRDVSGIGEIVLDPFCGSGTTILAAELTQRRARCIEIDPHYVDVAIARWQKRTGKTATLVDDGRSFVEIAAERSVMTKVAK